MTADLQQQSMCEDCRTLVNAGRSTLPHDNLLEYQSKKMSDTPGPTDERYYLCNVCGRDWTVETRGRGWIAY